MKHPDTEKPKSGATILRWVALPFVPFIGATTGMLLAAWVVTSNFADMREGSLLYYVGRGVGPAITHAVFGGLYVLIACWVAPRGKNIVGVVMTTILGCFLLGTSGVMVALASRAGDAPLMTEAIKQTVFSGIMMVAAIITLIKINKTQVKDSYEEENLKSLE